jgi:hypothetical protein
MPFDFAGHVSCSPDARPRCSFPIVSFAQHTPCNLSVLFAGR